MIKIEGLEEFSRDIKEAQQALQQLDGDLGSVNFDPDDPASIEAAIAKMDAIIDEKVGKYASNPIIGPMDQEMKEHFRQGIIEKAAAARLGDGENNAENS